MTLPTSFLSKPIAHRGLHSVSEGRAENSRKAFAAAIERGYGIELDLQFSADGVPMVFHDYSLDRLTDRKGAVAQMTGAELAAIPLKHDGDGIPTLRQVLDQVAGQVPLLIEIKDQDGALGPNIGQMGRAIANEVAGYKGDYAMMSFNPHAVIEMKKRLPETPRGLVTDPFTRDDWPTIPSETRQRLAEIPDYAIADCCFISHNVNDLGSARVAELKAGGADILCWTVKSKEVEANARRVADNVTFEGYLA